MLIAQDKVVLIHYTLKNDAGEVIDSSSGGDPLAYIHGQGNIVPGLEKALDGKNLNFDVEVTEVREPSEEELAHGHVHGPGGHHHHD